MRGVVRVLAFRAEHGEDARARRQQQDAPAPRQLARAVPLVPSLKGHEARKYAHRAEQRGGEAEADVCGLAIERIEDVAEGSRQQNQEHAEPESDPAAEQDQERRAEQDVAEQVAAVGVQGQRGHAAVPFPEYPHPEHVQRADPRPLLGIEAGQAGRAEPVHPDAVPENEQKQQGQHPVGVVARGRFHGDRTRDAFGAHGLQLGAGLPFEQGGNVQPELVAPARELVRDAARGEDRDPQIKKMGRRQGGALFAVVDHAPEKGDAVGADPEARLAPARRSAGGSGRGGPEGRGDAGEGSAWRCHGLEVRPDSRKAKKSPAANNRGFEKRTADTVCETSRPCGRRAS